MANLVESFTGQRPRGSVVGDLLHDLEDLSGGSSKVTSKKGVKYDDFVETVETRLSKQESELKVAFKMFDKNGDGKISKEEAKLTFKQLGEDVSDAELESLIKMGDKTGDGHINYEEFATFFGVMLVPDGKGNYMPPSL